MWYIIQLGETPEKNVLYAAPVDDSDAKYLERSAAHFEPLSHEQYFHGLAVVFHTGARYSYILDDEVLLVCIEWQPGLIVIKIRLGQELQWVAIRSPVPNFGGREPLPEDGDPDDYEDIANPHYNLVYTPWDSQFDDDDREYHRFAVANQEIQDRFLSLLALLQTEECNILTYAQLGYDHWRRVCTENLAKWCGTGLRL